MTVLERISFFQNRRDEVPNQLLAKELVKTKNQAGIQEIADNLESNNKNVRSDCLKVLYEIGYLDPSLIDGFTSHFLRLLKSKDNRMVWGAMIGLSAIAGSHTLEIWPQIDDIIQITERGTVITLVWGIRLLAKVAAAEETYKLKIFPFLLQQVQACIARDIPTHTESILCAVDNVNKGQLLSILENRRRELSPSQLIRFKKVLKQIEQIN